VRLIIVRHAIAEDRDAKLWPNDGERPLTKRGRRRFTKAAEGLAQLVPEVDIVLSSPYVRAWGTALILAEEADWPQPVACDELRDSPPWDVIRAVQARTEGAATVALVGHEPYLGRLVTQLVAPAGGAQVELRKGAAVCIEQPALGGEQPARLIWLLQPKVLRMLTGS
jgi:phosphohistidine phosphatase